MLNREDSKVSSIDDFRVASSVSLTKYLAVANSDVRLSVDTSDNFLGSNTYQRSSQIQESEVYYSVDKVMNAQANFIDDNELNIAAYASAAPGLKDYKSASTLQEPEAASPLSCIKEDRYEAADAKVTDPHLQRMMISPEAQAAEYA